MKITRLKPRSGFIFKKSNDNPESTGQFESNQQQQFPEKKLNVQMLRVGAYAHLQQLQQTWSLNQQQLLDFLCKYEPLPGSKLQLSQLFSKQSVKLVRNGNKIYFGEIKQRKKHGVGITIYREGKIFEGNFYLNQKQGEGVELYSNGNYYIGQFSQNKKHGHGTFYWFSLCEQTRLIQNKVESYEGDWWGGLPDGRGRHQKANGDVYIGGFKNGLKHANGIEYYANGDVYKGQFINGLPEGFGQYVWEDKSIYKGDFKQGYRSGYGAWRNNPINKIQQIYKGHYILDKKHGYGSYDWGNGYLYRGQFEDDMRNGEGQLYFNNTLISKGRWHNGEKQNESNHVKNSRSFESSKNKKKPQSAFRSRKFSTNKLKSNSIKTQKTNINDQFHVSFKTTDPVKRVGHRNCIPIYRYGKRPKTNARKNINQCNSKSRSCSAQH